MVTFTDEGRTADPVHAHSSAGLQPAGGGPKTHAAAELP